MTYYVATYRPPHPEGGLHFIVYKDKDYAIDVLPATVTSLWRVESVTKKDEAIACVMEFAAGKKVCVTRILP